MMTRHLSPHQGQFGFTMLELMVCVAILGILASIGIPRYIQYLPKSRLNGATSMIVADLMGARMKANKLNRKVQVYFINNHQYRICDDADGQNGVANPEGDAVLRDIWVEYEGVTISANKDPLFSPRGTASNFGSIDLSNGGDSKRVSVSITGLARVVPT